ncbi:MAG: 4Fe-4S binding protein [Peptococcaceae bacterium]|jgi:NAD-dependent dihydropyrimidine dehydrogenase PreA subunit|nr:4Fe-4S binding protein [Peptococcaceae bacterium]
MKTLKKIAVIHKECVACGSCLKGCPRNAVAIYKGSIAVVDGAKCVGCGKCAQACPANSITLAEVAIV